MKTLWSHLVIFFAICGLVTIFAGPAFTAEPPVDCRDFIGTDTYNRLQFLSDEGVYGGDFRDGLRDAFVPQGCSEGSIGAIMLTMRFRQINDRDFAERQSHFDGFSYDRIVTFCRPPRQVLRKLFYRCGGAIYIFFSGSKVVGVQGNASV